MTNIEEAPNRKRKAQVWSGLKKKLQKMNIYFEKRKKTRMHLGLACSHKLWVEN